MAKKQTAPVESMRMNIELADNGIILRNPDCEDEVTLAMTDKRGYSDDTHLSDEYKAIGEKIYTWLIDYVADKHKGELIITNFDIEVKATAKGREFAK